MIDRPMDNIRRELARPNIALPQLKSMKRTRMIA